uniref:Uncharacterized protein n=1 Tax=Parascaris equorum TaxID=6256 RepID=A0A914RMB5_PAREQ
MSMSHLFIASSYASRQLMSQCAAEFKSNVWMRTQHFRLQVRSRTFDLRLKYIDNIEEVRDRLRFLVLRQRVPHSILRLPFEWEILPAEKPRHSFTHLQKYFNFSVLKNTFLNVLCFKNGNFAY